MALVDWLTIERQPVPARRSQNPVLARRRRAAQPASLPLMIRPTEEPNFIHHDAVALTDASARAPPWVFVPELFVHAGNIRPTPDAGDHAKKTCDSDLAHRSVKEPNVILHLGVGSSHIFPAT